MKEFERSSSLTYGKFDERPPIGRDLSMATVLVIVVTACYAGYVHGEKLEQAALGKSKNPVASKEQAKINKQITEDNREWLTGIVKKEGS